MGRNKKRNKKQLQVIRMRDWKVRTIRHSQHHANVRRNRLAAIRKAEDSDYSLDGLALMAKALHERKKR